MANLIEFQQPHIAAKFINILKEIKRQGKNLEDEFNEEQLIDLYWSLFQIEEGVELVENLKFMNKVNIDKFQKYK